MVMPNFDTTADSGLSRRREQYARWAQLLDTILPTPDENRLVSVAEVGRSALPMVEGSLADIGVTPVVSETKTLYGESRYSVLVPARDADVAGEAVAGY
jgi:hypothetical protein